MRTRRALAAAERAARWRRRPPKQRRTMHERAMRVQERAMDDLFRLTQIDSISGRPEPMPAARRIDALLEHPKSVQMIRGLDPQVLYSLVAEAGIEDGMDLVLYASPQQVQAIVDFDCWTRDSFEVERFSSWLEVLLQREEEDFEAMVAQIDPEPLVLFLREQCQIFLWEDDRDLIETIDLPVCSSPDGVYALVIPDEERMGGQIRLLLERLYAISVETGHRFIESARWEVSTDLTEAGYAAREARLGDLGFVPVHEAIEVYAALDPTRWAAEARAHAAKMTSNPIVFSDATALPPTDFMLQQIEMELASEDAPLFVRAVASLGTVFSGDVVEPLVDSLFAQLRALANRVHVADLGHPGDINGGRKAVTRAIDHLSIGLELATGGQVQLAARVIGTAPLRDIHRAGYSALSKLAAQANAIARRGNLSLTDQRFSLLDANDVDLFEGLLARRPRMSALTERPFRTLLDVEDVARRLSEVAFAELVTFSTFRHTKAELQALVFDAARSTTPVELVSFRLLFATRVLGELAGERGGLTPLRLDVLHRVVAGLGEPHDAHSKLTSTGVRLVVGASKDGVLGPLATAYAARIAGWVLDELGGGVVPPEVARQVVLLSP